MQMVFPNSIMPIRLNQTTTYSDKLVIAILCYFVLYISLLVFGATFLMVSESCDMMTALSASATSIGNVEAALGKAGPTQNFAWMSLFGKWCLSFLMLAGRLELYAALILFLPSTWKK